MDLQNKIYDARRLLRVMALAFPEPEYANWSDCFRLIDQVANCRANQAEYGTKEEVAGPLFHKAAVYQRERGNFDEAEQFFQASREAYLLSNDDNSSELAAVLDDLARMWVTIGRYLDAERYFEDAASMRLETLGEKHPDYANSLHGLGVLQYSIGKMSEAETTLNQVLHIRKQYESILPQLAIVNILANLALMRGDIEQALVLASQAEALTQRFEDDEHPESSQVFLTYARIHRARGNYEKAEEYLLMGLERREDALRIEHARVASCLFELAGLYLDQEKFDIAEEKYNRALRIQASEFGDNHPNYALILSDLGELCSRTGRTKEALTHYHRAFEISYGTISESHPKFQMRVRRYAKLIKDSGLDLPEEVKQSLIRADKAQSTIPEEYLVYGW